MRRHPIILYTAIIAVCYLYTGSAYMSQFYRLMEFYDGTTVDIITSGWNYLLQAAGIGLFCLGLWKKPDVFRKKTLFAVLLATGALFMAASQLAQTGLGVVLSGYVFELHIGMYFGFYLTMFAGHVPVECAGLCYGAAYAVGSVGTYILSLIGDGAFLVSKVVVFVYIALALLTEGLVLAAEDIDTGREQTTAADKKPELRYLVPVVAVMMVISVVGSGLYYSMPQARDVDWNLIRAFYAMGLVLAGIVMDRSRLIGDICAAASLAYPLIVMALIGEGVTNTVTMGLSYAVRGFLSVYYVLAFTDIGAEQPARLPLAPVGLLIARVVEAILSLLLMWWEVPEVLQLVFSAVIFLPLLILFVLLQNRKYAAPPVSEERRYAMFAEQYNLTARESQILRCLAEGLSDDEIAGRCYISKSTVRFHISNMLKKTESKSRVDVIRKLEKS